MSKPKTVVLLVTIEETALAFYGGYVRFLKDRGWRVLVGANSPSGRLKAWAQSEGAKAVHIPWKRNPDPLSDLVNLVRTWRLLRGIRPDAVVAATPKAGLIGMLAASLARVPVRIYQLWGLRLETTGGLARKVLAALERVSIACSTQCVANSRSLAARTTELGLAGRREIVVLGAGSSHGVNTDRYRPGLTLPMSRDTEVFLEDSPADLTAVFVGRLHPDKGIDTLVEALRMCLDRDLRVRTLVVGGAEGAEVETYLSDLPDGLVHLVGHVEDVRPYILAADVLCLPSLREGFPNVVLEAAALGVPAVVSDATGVVDSVVDGQTGVLFPTGDAPALADALTRLAEDRDYRRRLGESARRRTEDEFDQPRIWGLQADNLERQVRLRRGADA